MTLILVLITLFILFYLLVILLIHVGLNKQLTTNDKQPFVSVLIAARNEEDNLNSCLASIEKLDYPNEKIEILVINDRSTDGTQKIAESFCKRLFHFQLINIEESQDGLYGKMNALKQGIEKSSGEIILVTDADCEVPEYWVSGLVKYFDTDVGMCGGLTVLSKNAYHENFFSRLQILDWIFLQSVASGSCQLGLPVSILGNNFAFRRKAYEDIGGFEQLGFSLTEDMILLQAIHNSKKWKIVYPLNIKTQIYSKPVKTIKEFYNQRKRWVLGGRTTHLWGYIIFGISLITHILLLGLLTAGAWKLGLLLLVFVIFLDATVYGRILKRIKRYDFFKMILPYKLYYFLYAILFSVILFSSKKVKWKNESYKL